MIIHSNEKALPYSNWLFTIIWFGFTAMLLWMMLTVREMQGDPTWWVPFGLFLSVGLFCLSYDIHKLFQWRRFGAVIFHTDDYPKVGGKLDGSLVFSKVIKSGAMVEVTLTCNHLIIANEEGINGKTIHRRHDSTIGISRDKFITQKDTYGRVLVDITLDVPSSGKPTDMPKWFFYRWNRSYYYWVLVAKSELEGIDFSRSYPIVVHDSNL